MTWRVLSSMSMPPLADGFAALIARGGETRP